jgi:hypothetical protein
MGITQLPNPTPLGLTVTNRNEWKAFILSSRVVDFYSTLFLSNRLSFSSLETAASEIK